jgi:hypothetical protein
MEEGSSTGDFESWMKGLWGWSIALPQEAPWNGPQGGLLSPGNLKDEVSERYANVLRRASIFIGALLGNLEGIHLLGLLRDG